MGYEQGRSRYRESKGPYYRRDSRVCIQCDSEQDNLKKTTGNVTVSAFDAGEEITEKSSTFDAFIQIIDGSAEIVIDNKKYRLTLGQGIIIPAHQRNSFYAKEPFKMISTVIKSGYE